MYHLWMYCNFKSDLIVLEYRGEPPRVLLEGTRAYRYVRTSCYDEVLDVPAQPLSCLLYTSDAADE